MGASTVVLIIRPVHRVKQKQIRETRQNMVLEIDKEEEIIEAMLGAQTLFFLFVQKRQI